MLYIGCHSCKVTDWEAESHFVKKKEGNALISLAMRSFLPISKSIYRYLYSSFEWEAVTMTALSCMSLSIYTNMNSLV